MKGSKFCTAAVCTFFGTISFTPACIGQAAVSTDWQQCDTMLQSSDYSGAISICNKIILDNPGSDDAVEAMFKLSQIYGDTGQQDLAIQQLTKIVAQYPKSAVRANLQIGYTYLVQGKYAEAINTLKNGIASVPVGTPADDHDLKNMNYHLAESYRNSSDWDNAIALYKKLVASYPDDAAANRLDLAACYMSKGDYSSAISELIAIKAQYPANAQNALRQLGNCYQSTGDFDKAISIFQQMMVDYPSEASLRMSDVGQCYQGKGDYAQAISTYASFISQYSSAEIASEVKMRMGECYQALKRYPEAIETFKGVISTKPDLTDYVTMISKYKLGECYRESKDWDNGIALYQQMVKDYPSDAGTNMLDLGTCYEGKGDLQQAMSVFQSTADKYPAREKDAMLRVCDCLNGLGKYKEELTYLNDMESSHPEYQDSILFKRALLKSDNLKQYQEAINDLQLLADNYSKSCNIAEVKAYLAGITLSGLRDISTARSLLESIVQDYPDYDHMSLVKQDLAKCCYREHDYGQAGKFYEESCDAKGPEGWKPFLLYMAGDSYSRVSGMEKQAVEVWQKLIKLYPNDNWSPVAAKNCSRIEGRNETK